MSELCNALYSTEGISFWGGIDPLTGKVIDQTHPLHGASVADKILVIPSGRGSCTGSQVMLELILNGKAPRAIILRAADTILCTGAIVAEEFFGHEFQEMKVPIICAVGEENFAQLVDRSHDMLSIKTLVGEDICIQFGDNEIFTKHLHFLSLNCLSNLKQKQIVELGFTGIFFLPQDKFWNITS